MSVSSLTYYAVLTSRHFGTEMYRFFKFSSKFCTVVDKLMTTNVII